MGTIGGALANNDPAACYPAAVLGLNATVNTNKRKIAADDFFKGLYQTALADDEIITTVSFPIPKKAAYVKFVQPASRFALVGVFVAQTASGVRVAVTGAGPSVFRAKPLEDALGKSFTADAAKAVKIDAAGLNNDIHGSAEYRAHLISVLASRAVAAAVGVYRAADTFSPRPGGAWREGNRLLGNGPRDAARFGFAGFVFAQLCLTLRTTCDHTG